MKKICIAMLAALTLWACGPKKKEEGQTQLRADSAKTEPKNKVTAKGPKPDWAPGIHDEMLAVIEKLESYGAKPIETLTPKEARKNPTPADAVKDLVGEHNVQTLIPKVDTVGKNIPVSGGNIHLRVYTPQKPLDAYPVILYIHGGGWVIATIDTYDASASTIAEQADAIVVSVEYRKGPEHKFPAAHNDAYAAYEWILKNCADIKADTSRIALVGESAGGNLAINVAIKARDKKTVQPEAIVAIYPVAQSNMSTESYVKNANARPLNKAMMEWFVKNALPSPATAKDPRIDLTKADLKRLPPTTIITAEYDPLMSDGELLRDKLKDAGVDVSYELYKGVTHEFFGMHAVVPEARKAQKYAVNNIVKNFKLE